MKIHPAAKGAGIALMLVLLAVVGLWVALGSRLGVWTWQGCQVYLLVTRGITIGQDLWVGNIKPGDDVEALIAGSNPQRVDRSGPWTEVSYIPGGPTTNDVIVMLGVEVLAKDGKLMRASFGSCTYSKTFFNIMTPEDETAYGETNRSNWLARINTEAQGVAQQAGGK